MKSIYPLVNSHITMERSTIHPASRGVAVFISVRERGSGWFSPVGATQAPSEEFSRENQSIDRCVMVELPGLVNVYITYITMERSTIETMGKSTISTGPFSIANCEITRG